MVVQYITIFIFLILLKTCFSSSCRGCIELDELSFDKLMHKFPIGLVKFDIAFPYGEQHEQYAKFAKEIGSSLEDVLIATVGVKDYGDRDNLRLAERYSVTESDFPAIKLFKRENLDEYISFPEHKKITSDNIKQFLQEHTNIYIGLDGCLKPLDDLTLEFVEHFKSGRIDEAHKSHQTLENLQFSTEKELKSKEYYNLIMKKILLNDLLFIEKETERIKKLFFGSITEEKKNELNRRLNVLQTFHKAIKNFKINKIEL